MKIIGGIIVLLVAVWLYVVSTKMVNKDKDDKKSGCDGNCASCMSSCISETDKYKSH